MGIKPQVVLVIFWTLLGWGRPILAAEFVTIDERSLTLDYYADPAVQRELAQEKRLAEHDPEGNWGLTAEGFRLSIRFLKDTYTNGEPISAIILERNITEQPLTYTQASIEWSFQFAVSKDRTFTRRTPLGEKWETFRVSGRARTVQFELRPLYQRRYDYNVNKLYEMTEPGEYVVYVTRQVPKLDGSGNSELRSGNAIIHVVDGSNPTTPKIEGANNSFTGPGQTGATPKLAAGGAQLAPSGTLLKPRGSAVAAGPAQAAENGISDAGKRPGSVPGGVVATTSGASGPPSARASNYVFGGVVGVLLILVTVIFWRAAARRKAKVG